MSQRRAELVVISSNGSSGSNRNLPTQGKLPIGLHVYSSNPEFQQKIDRLRSLRPGFVAVIERLVEDALDECAG